MQKSIDKKKIVVMKYIFIGLLCVTCFMYGWSLRGAMSMKYCLSVKLSVNPTRRDEFLQTIRKNAKGTLTLEPACRQYTWGESKEYPNVFHFQEQFDNKEGFIAHTKMPHFLEWEKFASSPDAFTAPPVLDFFEEL